MRWLLCSLFFLGIFVVYVDFLLVVFFFFKQKTAYEMRISDWSSDVCSSDLRLFPFRGVVFDVDPEFANTEEWWESIPEAVRPEREQPFYHLQIGRASCRERVCQYV